MEHSPSWEANSRSAGPKTPYLFMEAEVSLPCSQERATGPYPETPEFIPHPHIQFS
jgi:hypothetical protein